MAKSRSGILEIQTVQKYIETVAEDAGLSVRFDPKCTTPMTSKNTMIIPKLTGNTTRDDIAKLRWWVLHECLHHTKGKKAFELGDELGFDARHSPLATIWNVFEDNRIERAGSKDYKGDNRIIDEGWRLQTEEAVDNIAKVLKDSDDSYKKVGAAWYYNVKARSNWSPPAGEFQALMDREMTPEVQSLVDKLGAARIDERLNQLSEGQDGPEQSLALAKEVYEILFEESADKHIKEMQQKMAEQRAKEGKGNKGEKGNGKLSNGDGESGCDSTNGGTVNYEVFEHHKKPNPSTGGTGINLDYTKYFEEGGYGTYDPGERIHWINYRTGKASDPEVLAYNSREPRSSITKRHLNDLHRSEGEPGKGFGNKIRRLLQVRSQAKYVGGQKKGKLHMKNVYRACTNLDKYNEKIFRTKNVNDTLDTAVTVLCDLSGSMNGHKVCHAIDSAVLLNDSIGTSLRIPLEVLGFSEYGDETFVGIVKEFSQPASKDIIVDNFTSATNFMSANADGEAIIFAYDRLRKRPEKRRILIVISDGSPSCSRGGDIASFTKKTIKAIEDEKEVEIYAVGIMTTSVKHFYKNHIVIQHAKELETTLIELIRRSIFSN